MSKYLATLSRRVYSGENRDFVSWSVALTSTSCFWVTGLPLVWKSEARCAARGQGSPLLSCTSRWLGCLGEDKLFLFNVSHPRRVQTHRRIGASLFPQSFTFCVLFRVLLALTASVFHFLRVTMWVKISTHFRTDSSWFLAVIISIGVTLLL